MVRRVLLPFLRPAIFSAALIAFLQSFENYNTRLFVIGAEDTLTINIATRVRLGLTPAVNAVGVLFIAATLLAATGWAMSRRRENAARLERPAAGPGERLIRRSRNRLTAGGAAD
jgi:spermidine/putrescine transport system permease protein